jgi:peptidoglycan/LPS O-acetylase OafA/YrhL
VIGVNRIIFSFIAIGIVLWFWKLYLSNFRWWYVILEKFGLATYGIYLLHPIITSLLSPVIEKIGIFNVYVKMLLIACVTISISLFTYYFFEKKFLDLGKKLTNQNGFITKLLTHR